MSLFVGFFWCCLLACKSHECRHFEWLKSLWLKALDYIIKEQQWKFYFSTFAFKLIIKLGFSTICDLIIKNLEFMTWNEKGGWKLPFVEPTLQTKPYFLSCALKKKFHHRSKTTDGLFVNEMTFYLLLLNEVHK